VFNSINLSGAVAPVFNLGNGSLRFNGGLRIVQATTCSTRSPTMALASSLVSLSAEAGGVFTPLFSLGSGFVSGLTLDSNDGFFYGDLGGPTVSPLFGLGFGFMGGLTFDPNNGLFYALSADGNGVQRLHQPQQDYRLSIRFGRRLARF
jgi:hypothetical protein